MKRFSIFLFATQVILVGTISSQWNNKNSQSIIGAYSTAQMVNSTMGWLASSPNILLKTTDAGDSWSLVQFNDSITSLWGIKFFNDSLGFLTGSRAGENFSSVFKTTDGGNSWYLDSTMHSIAASTPGFSLRTINFTQDRNANTVWLTGIAYTGAPPMLGFIYYSTDLGEHWNKFIKTPDSNFIANKVLFIDSTNGFISTSQSLFMTTNAGTTWDEYKIFDGAGYFIDYQFFNRDTGIFLGQGISSSSSLYIGKTYDSGETWLVDSTSSGFFKFMGLPVIYFTDMNQGFAVNWQANAVIRTTDGGYNWTEFKSGSAFPLMSVHSADGKNVIVGGNGGTILVSHDSGVTYNDLTPPPVINFSYVKYLTENLVVALGNENNLFLSIDAGKSWSKYLIPTGVPIGGITFLDTLKGWIADDSSRIYHTNNTGKLWVLQKEYNYPDRGLNSIHFYNSSVGCAVGQVGFITHTSNGGDFWVNKESNTTNTLNSVFVASSSKAWAVGYEGTIIYSADSCNSWSSQTSPVNSTLHSITFSDTLNGYILAEGGVVLKTTNGGIDWEIAESLGVSLNAIRFINSHQGWVIGNSGKIFRTLNGGQNWDAQESGVDVELTGIDFIDSTKGIIVGNDGIVLSTYNGGGPTFVVKENTNLSQKFILHQNYPNPFNPITNFQFSVPHSGLVSLRIFDLLGREIRIIVNEELPPGRYTKQWNASGFSSGVYFYRLQAGSFVETKKLLLLK